MMEPVLLQAYDAWLAEHLEELMNQYPRKVVAISQGKIIIVGDSEIEVYREIRAKGIEPMPLVFQVPREEDFQSLLYVSSLFFLDLEPKQWCPSLLERGFCL